MPSSLGGVGGEGDGGSIDMSSYGTYRGDVGIVVDMPSPMGGGG